MQRPALVLDGNLKSALAIVRSLGRAGVPVICAAERGTAMAGYSRFVKERVVYPSPKKDQTAFIEWLHSTALRLPASPVVFACSDATAVSILVRRHELGESIIFPASSQTALDIAFDKAATYSEAKVHGVPVITTHTPERLVEVERLSKTMTYPCVVKPRQSVVWHNKTGVSGTASFVHSAEELISYVTTQYEGTGQWPIVQPFIEGEEYGVEMLTKDGVVFAETIHHRIRSLSPRGGASVVKETSGESTLINELIEHARTLVTALVWTGPIMVEFKVDQDNHQPRVMEINGRWWGSLPLAIHAGVEFPQLYYRLATGDVSEGAVVTARPGVVSAHFLGDVQHLLRVLFARDPMRSRLYPTRKKAWKDFISRRGMYDDVWSWSDPLPGIMEYIDVMMKKLQR